MQLLVHFFSAVQSVLHLSPGGPGAARLSKPSNPAASTVGVCVWARHAVVVNRLLSYYSVLLFVVFNSGVVRGATENAPTAEFYGYLDLGPRYSDLPSNSRWTIDSRGSYLGVAGASDLNSDTRVLFQLEYEIYPDGGDAGSFQRNDVFLGIKTAVGVFRVGVMETPLRHLADPIDLFPDTLGDPSELWNGDLRTSNTVYYQAPEIQFLPIVYKAELAVVLPGESDAQPASTSKDGYSASLWFGDEDIGLAVAAERHIGGEAVSRQRIATYWSTSIVRLGAAIERESAVVASSSLAKLVSAAASLGKGFTVKAQYGKSEIQGFDKYLLSLGGDVLFADNLTVYVNVHDHRMGDGTDFFSLESGLRYSF